MRQAQRTSANRERGTWEPHNIKVTKEVYVDYLLSKVIPAIKQKWPDRGLNRRVRLQQDNARTHCEADHPDVIADGTVGRWDIRIQQQPHNSPDFNVLDLAFFRSLQSLQWRLAFPNNKQELINRVNQAWNEYPVEKVDDAFRSLVLCVDEAVKERGGNTYTIPHTNKERTRCENNGVLPARYRASEEACRVYEEMGIL